VRLPRDSTPADAAGRRREAEVWARAAAAGVAPEPLLVETEAGVLVTPLVAEEDLATHLRGRLPAPELLEALGHLVGRFHAVDVTALPAFDPVARIDAALQRAEAAGRAPDPAVILARGRLPALERSALVHHDLIPHNVLVGERLWIVDLESAGLGDPDLDLVTLATTLELGAEDEARLFAAARRPLPSPARLRALRLLFQLGEHAWAAARLAEGRDEAGIREQFESSLEALRQAAAAR
jgi:Predicted choline kinase involved in LPS biosynthesis